MKIQTLPFTQIQYHETTYDESLYTSLKRMGLGFPIKIKRMEDGSYLCVDGHKRMNAIHAILDQDPTASLQRVSVLIVNDARTSSGTTMNHH